MSRFTGVEVPDSQGYCLDILTDIKMTIHEINICTVDLYADVILYLNSFQVSMVQEKNNLMQIMI